MAEKTTEAAVDTGKLAAVIEQAYLDSFVKSAAALGIAPSSDEELDDMLKTAARIREIQSKSEPVVKQARASIVHQACEALYALPV
jgi:hypothetical protein